MAEVRVTFDGLVAWVPRAAEQEGADPPAYAVLLPDAQFAEAAPWSRSEGGPLQLRQRRQLGRRRAPRGGPRLRFPQIREPHTAMLHFNVDQAAVPGVHAVISDPRKPHASAIVLLGNRRVTFSGLAESPLIVEKGRNGQPLGDLPHMKTIAPGHQWVAANRDPRGGDNLSTLGLAGALEIDRGTLAVTREFDEGREVRFGAVEARNGSLQFSLDLFQQPLGNQVTWTAPLADDAVTIELQDEDGRVTFQLTPPEDGVVRVTIANVELEVPVFRRNDPFTPFNRLPLPDPDFGVFYELSAGADAEPRRFVVPPDGGALGSRDKPCAPTVFSGFST